MARPRIPTQLKVLKRTAQSSRMNPNEPKLDPNIPKMPEGLDDEHRRSWERHVVVLAGMRVLTIADEMALECLVRAHVELSRLQREMAALPSFVQSPSGLWKKHPGVSAVAEYDRRYHGWLAKFGLTPADRSRVSAAPVSAAESGWAKIRRGL